MISAALFAHISTAPGLEPIGDRWFPGMLPQGKDLPAGVFTCISRVRIPVQNGGGPFDTRYQFDMYSNDPEELEALSVALESTMGNYRGTITVAGTVYNIIISMLDSGDGPNYQPKLRSGTGPEPGLFRVRHDYKITHAEVTNA